MQVTCQKCGRDATIPSNTNPAMYHCGYCFGPVVTKETGLSGVGLAAALGLGAFAMGGTLYALSQAMKEDRENTSQNSVRRAFYSFHFDGDSHRASQVRNYGVVVGKRPTTDNEWETVRKGNAAAIERWISGQLDGKTCAIVLIGAQTAGRKWINYEIIEAWKRKIGILGVHIHNLKNLQGEQCAKGANPFSVINLNGGQGAPLSNYISVYDPPYTDSQQVYAYIGENISSWVEAAINQRKD